MENIPDITDESVKEDVKQNDPKLETETLNEVIPEVSNKEIEIAKKNNSFSVFVTEKDLFDIKIKCYKEDSKLYVEEVDLDYDDERDCKTIMVTFKKPSQGDLNLINTQASKWSSGYIGEEEESSYKNFMSLEFARLIVLIRTWSESEELTVDNIVLLDPKIIKGMISKIRNEIGMDGII